MRSRPAVAGDVTRIARVAAFGNAARVSDASCRNSRSAQSARPERDGALRSAAVARAGDGLARSVC